MPGPPLLGTQYVCSREDTVPGGVMDSCRAVDGEEAVHCIWAVGASRRQNMAHTAVKTTAAVVPQERTDAPRRPTRNGGRAVAFPAIPAPRTEKKVLLVAVPMVPPLSPTIKIQNVVII